MSHNSFSTDDLPIVPFDYGLVLKEGLFSKLYWPQINYWNDRLRKISEENVAAYAREDDCFNTDDTSFVSIFYEGATHGLLAYDEDDDPISPYCLEAFTGDPKLLENIKIVVQEVNRLKKERYEALRFLSGLAMFDPHPKDLERILGDGLSGICHTVFHENGWTFNDIHWDVTEPKAFETFIEDQQLIITAMQERMLLNMITI